MRAWWGDVSSNLVATLLAILVAYVAAQRFVDRRVASNVQVYVERGSLGRKGVIPEDGEQYRLHIHNASGEMIYEPRWIGTPGGDPDERQQLEPVIGNDGKALAHMLPGQTAASPWMAWHDGFNVLGMQFRTTRRRTRIRFAFALGTAYTIRNLVLFVLLLPLRLLWRFVFWVIALAVLAGAVAIAWAWLT